MVSSGVFSIQIMGVSAPRSVEILPQGRPQAVGKALCGAYSRGQRGKAPPNTF